MRLGMIGLGRMGSNMARRLLRAGHECVVFDRDASAVTKLVDHGAVGATSYANLIELLGKSPRVVWLMVPAAVVDPVIDVLANLQARDDVIIDGGNSHYHDDIRRSKTLASRGIHYLDVGTSGGVWGLERGYCQMIGGEAPVVERLEPIFAALAPAPDSVARTPGRRDKPSTAERGYLHCGAAGAGHFVKMVHNGIEYGLMAAYAEGLNILHHANIGSRESPADAETTPLRHPEHYRYDLDIAEIAELWRRGSVIASWLLDLAAASFVQDPDLDRFSGRVSDSGEGRWTLQAAIDEGVPAQVLAVALASRFASRGADDFANRVLSAMRFQFGGHHEKAAK
jgi:6-phosphogluconate dehydrogenase